ncbi:MAG: class I SAM-dependent methyltransferase [Chlamydiia bacterium]|nr:class I SAM-dependent methyltransferase [Chlamydiia bacterium]
MLDLPPPQHYEHVIDSRCGVQQTKQAAYQALPRLEGWCSEYKASVMIDYVTLMKPKKIVEIGVFGGSSLIPMAFALQNNGFGKIYGIDPWSVGASIEGMDPVNANWWSKVDHEKIYQGLLKKIEQYNLNKHIHLLRTTSEATPPIQNIDILHIDGNHSDTASYHDVNKWIPLVRPGGLIIFNDIHCHTTQRAVQWLDDNCHRLGSSDDNHGWGVWIRP